MAKKNGMLYMTVMESAFISCIKCDFHTDCDYNTDTTGNFSRINIFSK